MECQKVINLLDNTNTPNQPSMFRTKNWVEVNDDSRGTCSFGSQIKFKTSLLKSSSCDYGDAYILVKETIAVKNTGTPAAPDNREKKLYLKSVRHLLNV